MEIKCQYCAHIGAPSSMTPTAQGISLTCSSCGLANIVKNDSPPAQPLNHKTRETTDVSAFDSEENFLKLIPKQGAGYRCPKCLSILAEDKNRPSDNCRICGLDLLKDYNNVTSLPWERPPVGKDALFEQAVLLWSSLEESPTSLHFEKFIEFTNVSGFHDLQIRKLRQFLVYFPEDENALKYLRIQSQKIQTRIVVAQSQSQSQTQHLGSQLQKARQKLLLVVAFALIVLIVFFANFIYN